jgi:hypothetical protein
MSEKVIEKINWPLWIAFIVLLSIIVNIANGVLYVSGIACIYGLGTISMPASMPILAMLLPLAASLTGRFRKNVQSLAQLYLVGLVTSMFLANAGGMSGWMALPVGYTYRFSVAAQSAEWAVMRDTWFFVPIEVTRVVKGTGTWDINWAGWAPGIAFWTIYHFVYFLLGSSLMLLFRKRWIDVEKLPFPFMIGMWEGVSRVNEKRFNIAFILGILVGFLINLQILLTYLLPWWPDIIGWRANLTSPNGCAVVASWSNPITWQIGSTLIGFMRWNMQPLNFFIAYLVPLDVSFSIWLLTFVFMILVQIAYYVGYYPAGSLDLSGCCRMIGMWIGYDKSPMWGPPLYWSWLCLTGGAVGFVVMAIWRARADLSETLRMAFGKTTGRTSEEPFSYKTVYLYIIGSCIALLAFLFSIDITTVIPWIIALLLSITYIIGESYAHGLVGFQYLQGRDVWAPWPMKFIWPMAPKPYTNGYMWSIFLFENGINTAGSGLHTWGVTTLHGLALAKSAKLNYRTSFYLMALTLFIGLPISMLMRVWWFHIMGAKAPICGDAGWGCALPVDTTWNTKMANPDLMVGFLVAGFIIVAILEILRMRFTWWPIHPLGYLMSGGQRVTWTGSWTAFLGAWIAKWITLRVGGSKLYEEHGVAFIGGALAGTLAAIFIGILLSVMRFFIPF